MNNGMKNRLTKYYFGIYKDYYKEGMKIAELSLDVDNLSCEILAKPGCITYCSRYKKEAIDHAIKLAKENECYWLDLLWCKNRIIKIK
jgi:hypothetical protein